MDAKPLSRWLADLLARDDRASPSSPPLQLPDGYVLRRTPAGRPHSVERWLGPYLRVTPIPERLHPHVDRYWSSTTTKEPAT